MHKPLSLAAAIAIVGLALPGPAIAPTATTGELVHHWQARRLVRAAAALGYRPDFRIERTRRRDADTIEVYWSEPGGGPPDLTERDYGRDLVQRRQGQWWIRDGALGDTWRRFL